MRESLGMGLTNERVLLRRRPSGMLTHDDVELVREDFTPELGPNEVLVRNVWLAMDATVRSWLDEGEGYLPAVQLGEEVRCSSMGRVVASNSDRFAVGQWHAGLAGWQDYAVVDGSIDLINNPHPAELEALRHISLYASAGPTAYFGLTETGRLTEGETVLVSAAAGSVGSVVVQVAKNLGAQVIGIAGSDEKCAWVESLGAEACLNRHTDDLGRRLKELRPKGVDVYFDNVGGPILDIALRRIARKGRIVVCGAISMYNAGGRPPGPSNYLNLVNTEASMTGFMGLNYVHRYPECFEILDGWIDDGSLTYNADVLVGLDNCVDGLNALFTGANRGKSVVQVADDPGPELTGIDLSVLG
jgi:NADPH-dependent curcumin reductase CurA